jgi:hypothetical protein
VSILSGCDTAYPARDEAVEEVTYKFIDDAEYGFVDTEIRDAIFRAFGFQ